MGHKVHPMGFRIGVIRDWQANWYADRHYLEFVQEDIKIRQAIQSRYSEAGIAQVEIKRQANEVLINIHTSRPGVVIGRGGQRVDEMRAHLERIIGKRVRLNIMEVHQPELDATLVAKTVADQIQHRVSYRRSMKQAIFRAIQAGAKGVRVSCAGRLGGAEIARRQILHDGRVPLHTLRADIDFGFAEAHTTMGQIGIKVWIYRGDILPQPKVEEERAILETAAGAEETEVAVAGEPGEVMAESAVDKIEEAAPAVELEKEPAKPRTRRVAKTEPSAGAEGTPTKPRTRAKAANVEQETKPAKPKAKREKAAAPAKESEEEPAGKVATEPEPSITEEDRNDVTTEAGETPQDS